MSKIVEISQNQFMSFFGELNGLLKECRKFDGCLFVTEVDIHDIKGTNNIEVSFVIEYGPVARRDGFGDVDAEMLECKMGYLYTKDGKFLDETGKEPTDSSDFGPEFSSLPSFEDIPDPQDTEVNLFSALACIIGKCSKSGKLLHSIQFCALGLDFSYEYEEGTPDMGEDAGETEYFNGKATGISLSGDLKYEYSYSYSLIPSKESPGEWDLIFWVKM